MDINSIQNKETFYIDLLENNSLEEVQARLKQDPTHNLAIELFQTALNKDWIHTHQALCVKAVVVTPSDEIDAAKEGRSQLIAAMQKANCLGKLVQDNSNEMNQIRTTLERGDNALAKDLASILCENTRNLEFDSWGHDNRILFYVLTQHGPSDVVKMLCEHFLKAGLPIASEESQQDATHTEQAILKKNTKRLVWAIINPEILEKHGKALIESIVKYGDRDVIVPYIQNLQNEQQFNSKTQMDCAECGSSG